MPEGDSLHRLAASLQPLVGARVEATSPHPRGALTGVAAAVDGSVLEGVEAIGKNLVLRFEGGIVVRSHLRMSGRWRVSRDDAVAVRGLPWLVLRGGGWVAVQRNGPVLALDTTGSVTRALRRLGPDLLADDVDPVGLVARLRSTGPRRALGEALQDQRLVAGIGNLWMSEILHAVRVSPWLSLGEVTDDELAAALARGRDAMRASVGGPRPTRAVYRRAGRPCSRCGAIVLSRGQGDANRIAYWCPGCQRGPGAPGGRPVAEGCGRGVAGPRS